MPQLGALKNVLIWLLMQRRKVWKLKICVVVVVIKRSCLLTCVLRLFVRFVRHH